MVSFSSLLKLLWPSLLLLVCAFRCGFKSNQEDALGVTPKGFVKSNFDGSFLGNPGKISIRGMGLQHTVLRAFFQSTGEPFFLLNPSLFPRPIRWMFSLFILF